MAGITGKLTQGAVDAGFLYVSDVRATDGKLKAIELPDELQPSVAYGVAGGQGRQASRAGQGVHRRTARRCRRAGARRTRASSRRPHK